MTANHDRIPGGGSASHSLYPMRWFEGGRAFMYDGDTEHIPHDVVPPVLRELYRASMAARRRADEARWQKFVTRKCT